MPRVSDHVSLQCEVRHMLLALADMHGIRSEVERVLKERGTPHRYERWPLHRILRRRRKALGLPLYVMAERAGIAKSQLFRLESEVPERHLKRVPSEVVLKLARAYDLPIPLVVTAALRDAGLISAPGALSD